MWILVGAFKSLLYLFTLLLWLIVISSGTNFPIFDSLWKVRSTWSFFNENFTPWTNVCIVCSLLLLKEFCTEVHALDMHYTAKCDMLAIFANCALVILYGKSVNFAQNHKNRESQLGLVFFFFHVLRFFRFFARGLVFSAVHDVCEKLQFLQLRANLDISVTDKLFVASSKAVRVLCKEGKPDWQLNSSLLSFR